MDPDSPSSYYSPIATPESPPLKPPRPSISGSTITRSHPKRHRKSLSTPTTPRKLPSHHILDMDLAPFRLTKDDVELIKQCNRQRFQQNGKVISEHEQQLRELKIARRKMLVNYTADRHLTCAAVVHTPARSWPPLRETARTEGYLSWASRMSLYLSQNFAPPYTSPWTEPPRYDKEIFLSNVERVAVELAPWQEWFNMVRGVYRWENPLKTTRWMAVYSVLWWHQYLITFTFVYIIARVLRSRQDWGEVETVKTAISKAREQQKSVHSLEELIERHASDDWVELLPNNFGARAQLETGDFADLLEIIRNFYEWRRPTQTVHTLVLLGACLLLSLCTDVAYCWRLITFIFGLWFFVSSPVASLYPRYRWVVSPLRWALWGIPTHAEIAYSEFHEDAINAIYDPARRKKAARRRAWRKKIADYEGPLTVIEGDDEAEDEGYITNSPDLEEDDEEDPEELISPTVAQDLQSLRGRLATTLVFCGFKCVYRDQPGKLFVSDFGLLFETEVSKKLLVEVPWSYVKRIQKQEIPISMNGKGGLVHALDIVLVGEEVVRFDSMNSRDKAFKRIIGFSGLQWQSGL
ncbi:hypothetical protein TWF696_003876 [Orbilia brochopaga]|uniref:GRAM domain-containing protein n=1 Tax=Orbilia brochopaga TaxID=3140254 RepID=A0AAV9V5N3_9PEZI